MRVPLDRHKKLIQQLDPVPWRKSRLNSFQTKLGQTKRSSGLNFILKYLHPRPIFPFHFTSPHHPPHSKPAKMSPTTTTTTTSITSTTKQDASQDLPQDIPDLQTYRATTKEDLIPGLRLIADSIAQQRQTAAHALIFHPFWLSAMAALIAIVYKALYTDSSDLPLIGTTSAGCVMAGLLVVRGLTGGYIEEAERVGKGEWLLPSRTNPKERGQGEEQEILVTKFGERIIGVVVLRGVPVPAGEKKVKMTGVIWAWTVERRYRGKGWGLDCWRRRLRCADRKGGRARCLMRSMRMRRGCCQACSMGSLRGGRSGRGGCWRG